jgi:hypothetical protein
MATLRDATRSKLLSKGTLKPTLGDAPRSLQLLRSKANAYLSELLRRKTDGASQIIGNSLQNSVVLESLTFPPLVRSPGSQDPNLFLATYTY